MRGVRTLLAVTTLAVLAWGTAACGDSSGDGDEPSGAGAAVDEEFVDLSAAEIRDQVVADMQDLESLTLAAEVTSDDRELRFNLSLDTAGNCAGTVSLGEGSAEIRSVDDALYLKGDKEFWESGPTRSGMFQGMMGDRWAKLPPGTSGFANVCDLDGFLGGFDVTESADVELTKGEQGEVDGQPAIELLTQEDEPTSVWVSTGDDHYVLKLERAGDDPLKVTLSDFDEPVEVTAPSEDQVVDLSEMMESGS
jgi:hypothetical protein